MATVKIPFDLEPDEQAARARAANVLLPEEFHALPSAKRATAFTVSNLARLDQIQAVADKLAEMQATGSTFRDFQKWAAGQDWSLPKHRLETIYRNAVQTSYMAGHWRAFSEQAETFPYLMLDAVNDSRVRPSHLALDGVIRPVGDPFWKTRTPPLGHRCLLPGTVVSGDFVLGSKARYSGPAVEIETASGKRLSVTANHPIMTSRGWIAAQELKEGDNLLSNCGVVDWPALVGGVDDEHPPATVENVFDALSSQALALADVSTFDLHGDVKFLKSDVYVAGADCHLMHGVVPKRLQPLKDGPLIGAGDWLRKWARLNAKCNARPVSTIRYRHLFNKPLDVALRCSARLRHYSKRKARDAVQRSNLFLKRIVFFSRNLPCLPALSLNLFSVSLHGGPFHKLRLALPPQLDPASLQKIGDCGSVCANHLGQSVYACPGKVFRDYCARIFGNPPSSDARLSNAQSNDVLSRASLDASIAQYTAQDGVANSVLFKDLLLEGAGKIVIDNVASVRNFDFRGHVFDFQTKQGWMFADEVIVSNCRCTLKSLLPSEARERGGVTQNPPIEGQPDKGWGSDPREWDDVLARLGEEKAVKAPEAVRKAWEEIAKPGPEGVGAGGMNETAQKMLDGLVGLAESRSDNLLRAIFDNDKSLDRHIKKRIARGEVLSEQEYASKTFAVLASSRVMTVVEPVDDGMLPTGKMQLTDGSWVVLLGERGNIVTSYPFLDDMVQFEQRHRDLGDSVYEQRIPEVYREALERLFGSR